MSHIILTFDSRALFFNSAMLEENQIFYMYFIAFNFPHNIFSQTAYDVSLSTGCSKNKLSFALIAFTMIYMVQFYHQLHYIRGKSLSHKTKQPLLYLGIFKRNVNNVYKIVDILQTFLIFFSTKKMGNYVAQLFS
jgi:hypothetical protein